MKYNEYLTIKTTELALEKGFKLQKEETYYNPMSGNTKYEDLPARQSELQKWLREEHELILVIHYIYEYDSIPYTYFIYKQNESEPINEWIYDFSTYEEALEMGLQAALKMIHNINE